MTTKKEQTEATEDLDFNAQELDNLMVFMARIELKGAEVATYVGLVNKLSALREQLK